MKVLVRVAFGMLALRQVSAVSLLPRDGEFVGAAPASGLRQIEH